MNDYMIRATAAEGQIRAIAATTRDMVENAKNAHNTSPVATAALGRLMTAAAMMGADLKGEKDLLTLKIEGSGPLGGLLVTANGHGDVKGYACNPDVMLPPNAQGKLDVGGSLDLGVLSVIKDIGLKEPYVGQTQLVTGEIAEDLTYYFATSEQVPSSVGLGVLMEHDNTVKQAGGFIVQLMPFVDDDVVDRLEANIKKISSVTSMLDKGMTPEEILEEVLDGFEVEVKDTMPAQFYCNCTKERVEKAIISIGKKDIQEMIEDGKPIEVNCHICAKSYEFSVEELKTLIKKATR